MTLFPVVVAAANTLGAAYSCAMTVVAQQHPIPNRQARHGPAPLREVRQPLLFPAALTATLERLRAAWLNQRTGKRVNPTRGVVRKIPRGCPGMQPRVAV